MGPMMGQVGMVVRGESRTHRLLRSRLMFLLAVTVALDAVGTGLMFLFEHDARGSGSTTSAARCSGSQPSSRP